MSGQGGLVIVGPQGFANGKRLVRWLGYRPMLDQPDLNDPRHRVIVAILADRSNGYSPDVLRVVRLLANYTSQFVVNPWVGRQVYRLDEQHTTLSRPYRFGAGEPLVQEMDAADAEQVMRHPIIRHEFAYADVEHARTTARFAPPSVQRAWLKEMDRALDPIHSEPRRSATA